MALDKRYIISACVLGLIWLVGLPANASSNDHDAYSSCAADTAASVPLNPDLTKEWVVNERAPGSYPDGSIEGISTANAYSQGGVLHLTAHKISENAWLDSLLKNNIIRSLVMRNEFLRKKVTSHFVSGRIVGQRPIQFGCIEFTARLPRGRGYWPALWMRTPYGQQMNGEIDVLEGFGSHPGVFQSTLHHWRDGVQPTGFNPRIINGVDRTYTCARITAGMPQPAAATQMAIKKARWAGTDKWHLPNWLFANAETKCEIVPVSPSLDFSADFHRFLLVWASDKIIWALDGKPYYRTTDDVPQNPMVIIANLSVGKMDGYPDAATPTSGDFQVKSVRLMKLRP